MGSTNNNMCIVKHAYLFIGVFVLNFVKSSPFQGYMFGVYPPGIGEMKTRALPDNKIQLNFEKRSENEDIEARSGENGEDLEYPDLYDPPGRTHRGRFLELVKEPGFAEDDEGIFVDDREKPVYEARSAANYATAAEIDELENLQRK